MKVNKRTLHYYDSIGLFSPETKGDNPHYRYYDSAQSIHFEYIFNVKELNMRVSGRSQILLSCAQCEDFIAIVDQKAKEIDQKSEKLKPDKDLLQTGKTAAPSLRDKKTRHPSGPMSAGNLSDSAFLHSVTMK